MELLLVLLIIFLLILICGIAFYVLINHFMAKAKAKNKKVSWKLKYLKQFIVGVIVFSVAGIAISILSYFK